LLETFALFPKHNLIASPKDFHFAAFQAKAFRQLDPLVAAGFGDTSGGHV
jgi:hypothetical protein